MFTHCSLASAAAEFTGTLLDDRGSAGFVKISRGIVRLTQLPARFVRVPQERLCVVQAASPPESDGGFAGADISSQICHGNVAVGFSQRETFFNLADPQLGDAVGGRSSIREGSEGSLFGRSGPSACSALSGQLRIPGSPCGGITPPNSCLRTGCQKLPPAVNAPKLARLRVRPDMPSLGECRQRLASYRFMCKNSP